jgi:hypothetical protein
VIGNYDVVYRLATNVLRLMHKGGSLRAVEIPTSRGVLLPASRAEQVAIAVYRPACGGQMAEVIEAAKLSSNEARKRISALLTAMKCDPRQIDLFPCETTKSEATS